MVLEQALFSRFQIMEEHEVVRANGAMLQQEYTTMDEM